MPLSTKDILLLILALFIPPLPVFIKRGCGADFLINILLTLLGAIPGILHAWWVVFKYNDVDGYRDLEEGWEHHHHNQNAAIPRPVVSPVAGSGAPPPPAPQ